MHCSKSQKYRLNLLFFAIPFLLGIGIDLYVPSMPDIAMYFKVHQNLVQLTISFYMLGYAFGQIFLGILSDSYGRKKILIISGTVFSLASFLAVFSLNIYFLFFCRLLQGLGASGLGVVIRTLASDCFSGLSLKRSMTFISTSWALGPIIGPFIGGYLEHLFNWKMSFYVYGVYSLLIVIAILFMLKETNLKLVKLRPQKIRNDIKQIIAHPVFVFCTLILSLMYSILVIFNIVGPFLIQVTMKYSPIVYGHIAFILGFAFFLGNFINQFMLTYFNSMKISKNAMIGALLVSLTMVFLGLVFPLNLYVFFVPICLLFFLCGLIIPNLLAEVFTLFPQIAGTLSAIYGFFFIGGVFLMTILATSIKTSSQMPLSWLYMIILFISLVLFFVINKIAGPEKN